MFAGIRFAHGLRKLRGSGQSLLIDYANAPWPASDTPIRETPLLALDFELDGLKHGADLLQAGWVGFTARSIPLESANSVDIRSAATLNRKAVTIHGIGEQRAAAGAPLKDVVDALIADLAGKVLVAHGASIEVAALSAAVRRVYGVALPIRSVCTLALERSLSPNRVGNEAYRLGTARSRYGLPAYQGHDALGDAIAAAELLLAQLSRMPEDTSVGKLERMA